MNYLRLSLLFLTISISCLLTGCQATQSNAIQAGSDTQQSIINDIVGSVNDSLNH